ncbi:hypothetical protein [Sphingobacterium siyangense]|uniref:hypothetical protein n=1 Tax=Sphingobacterium siyangense TaxID=459529 RepID=UPI002FDC81D6
MFNKVLNRWKAFVVTSFMMFLGIFAMDKNSSGSSLQMEKYRSQWRYRSRFVTESPWMTWLTLVKQIEAAFDRVAKWDIKGIKVDIMKCDD